jgi:hypothetical protein
MASCADMPRICSTSRSILALRFSASAHLAHRPREGTAGPREAETDACGGQGERDGQAAGQATGEFYLIRESVVTAVHSNESFIGTEPAARQGTA